MTDAEANAAAEKLRAKAVAFECDECATLPFGIILQSFGSFDAALLAGYESLSERAGMRKRCEAHKSVPDALL